MAYDHMMVEMESEENTIIEQLMTENAQLRRLLKIEGDIETTEIEKKIKAVEEMVEEIKDENADLQKMPDHIRKILETKHKAKETERLVSLQMRKLAEQEILRETEKLSKRSRQPETQVDLSKTSKNISFLASAAIE